jgi:hypothetical protein
VRSFYNLEEVWGDKPVKMKSAPPKGAKKPAPKGAEKPAQEGATHGKASRRRRRR